MERRNSTFLLFYSFSNIWHSKSQSCRNSALFAPFFTLFKLPFKWISKAFYSQEEFPKEFNLKMGVRMRWRTESESEKNTIFPSFLVYLVSQQSVELPKNLQMRRKAREKKSSNCVYVHSYRVSVVKAFNLKL